MHKILFFCNLNKGLKGLDFKKCEKLSIDTSDIQNKEKLSNPILFHKIMVR